MGLQTLLYISFLPANKHTPTTPMRLHQNTNVLVKESAGDEDWSIVLLKERNTDADTRPKKHPEPS